MKRPLYSLIVSALLLLSFRANALSGSDYRQLSESQRLMWTVGVADGLLTAQLFATNKTPPMAECLRDLERDQIRAIFDKALDSDPERWQFPAAFMFYDTFREYCAIE